MAKTTAPKKTEVKKSEHPTYKHMIAEAITVLKERNGSSRQAIKKFIQANHKITSTSFDSLFNKALKSGVDKGEFVQPKGPSGPVKLQKSDPKKAAKKPAAKKAEVKKADTKKPVAKKAETKKPAAKKAEAKKPAAKKPTAKKTETKKPAAKKTSAAAAKVKAASKVTKPTKAPKKTSKK